MSEVTPHSEEQKPMGSTLLRGSIWVAIGAVIAAAIVCVIWVLIGDQNGIIGRAFLTILLLALFAGAAIVESNLADRRPDWLTLLSMISWIIVMLVGAVKIWLPEREGDFGWGMERFFQFLLVIGILQLAMVHVRLFVKASRRYVTTFTRVITMVTFVMLAAVAAMLVFYLTFPDEVNYGDLYWRIVIAVAILAAVGTTLIPLLNALFAPRARPQAAAPGYADPSFAAASSPQPAPTWPTYADGRTPLPVMPDGSPDWNAYYTGYPTVMPQAYAPSQSFPVPDAPDAPSGSDAPDVPFGSDAPAPEQPHAPADYRHAPEPGQQVPPVPPVLPVPPVPPTTGTPQ